MTPRPIPVWHATLFDKSLTFQDRTYLILYGMSGCYIDFVYTSRAKPCQQIFQNLFPYSDAARGRNNVKRR